MKKPSSLEVIGKQKRMMQISGLWPDGRVSYLNIFDFIACTISSIIMMTELVHVFGDFNAMSDILSLLISVFIYLVKHVIFTFKRREFLKSLEKLENPIFQKYPPKLNNHMQRSIRLSTLITTIYQASCAVVVTLYNTKPFLVKTYDLPAKVTWVGSGGYLYAAHFFESCSMFYAAWNNSCLDTLAAGLMMIGATHFDILSDKIVNARRWAGLTDEEIGAGKEKTDDEISEDTDNAVEDALKECVEYHIALLEFLGHIEECFSLGFLAQFFNSVIVICNTGFQLFLADPMSLQFATMIAYFFAMMIQLSLYCWFGNELTIKSVQLRDACYASDWTNCGMKIRKCLFIIMERSKRPVYFTAGKFANLTLTTYTAVIRSSYSYFALMQRLYGKDTENI